MSNLEIYEKYRAVPKEAQKKIGGGRLSGMTDINPMWRLKCLTEQFGPCGKGWYYNILKQWMEPTASGETAAFCDIHLFVKFDGEWSMPIEGTGGAMYIAKEKSGLYVDDESYKKALTDAISVACKALGFGADVYWDKDKSKYDKAPITEGQREELVNGIMDIATNMEKLEAMCVKRYQSGFTDLDCFQLSDLLDFLKAAKAHKE